MHTIQMGSSQCALEFVRMLGQQVRAQMRASCKEAPVKEDLRGFLWFAGSKRGHDAAPGLPFALVQQG